MTAKKPKAVVSTTVSSRYQTVIPAEVREKFVIQEGSRIAWVVKDESIEVFPLPEKAWKSFEGKGKGKDYLSALADYRRQERAQEKRDSFDSGRTPKRRQREGKE